MTLLDVALLLLAIPVAAACGYLLLLTLLSGDRAAPARGAAALKFDIVVPAHNEEAGISRTVANLSAVDWPGPFRRIVVVADNCTDGTAERAREAGATVLVRTDPSLRGKGHALKRAFEESLRQGFADAVVVVDADTVVAPNLLHAFASRLSRGAHAIQAHYGVSNPSASWRTRLMTVALALFNQVRSMGRERLGLSSGLRGNGMCFSRRDPPEGPARGVFTRRRRGVRDPARARSESGSTSHGRRTSSERWSPPRRRRGPSGAGGRAGASRWSGAGSGRCCARPSGGEAWCCWILRWTCWFRR